MAAKSFEVSHDLCVIKASTDDDQVKLFIDVEVTSRKQELTPKILTQLLTERAPQNMQIPMEMLHQGVLEDICKTLQQASKIEQRRVVKGTLPKKGIDGRLVFLKRKLAREPNIEGADDASTSVHLDELGLFENILSGEAVVRVYPPQEGTPGTNAFGQPIPAESGEPVKVSIDDKTLERSPPVEGSSKQYDVILSKVDGYLEQQGSKLAMQEVFVVTGNLDPHYGSLQFVGIVEVQGDVLPGFKIQAKKGIHIKGNANKTELTSSEGDIQIDGRFFGEGKGRIIGSKNVTVRSIQEVAIEALGDIYVQEEARNALLRTPHTIQIPQGTLLGGKAYTSMGVQLKTFGGDGDIESECYVGSTVETSAEFTKLLLRIKDHEKILGLLNAQLGPYADNPDRIQLLADHLRPKLQTMLDKREQVSKSYQLLLQKKQDLIDSAEVVDEIHVSIETMMYPGSTIHAGDSTFEVKEDRSGPITIAYQTAKEEFSEVDYVVVNPSSATQEENE